ncbi:dihydroorotase [Hydrotalea sp.]|uniref:dihydroorotase n=1 Tax=Hydrotalea sp. TaxID=2881279 RepID=UPI0026332F39|nr:dihydroorotase [Hydrotalea sp.]
MSKYLIRQASIVNEGEIKIADVLIVDERIKSIANSISANNVNIIDAEGLYLLPGMIDDQVHFREPGLTHKADIYSESKAAVAGGITSYMDMPNTIPHTLTQQLLEDKYIRASQKSLANYSFFMGVSKNNLEEALKTNNENVCGISDDGLYFNSDEGILANYPEFLEQLFSRTNSLVALHCEDDNIIKINIEKYRKEFSNDIPIQLHAQIRSEESCVKATERVLQIAHKHNNRLHLLHISTSAEANLLDNKIPIRQKRITAEACVHHLWFSDNDYKRLGNKIKWNPSIKTEADKNGLLQSLLNNKLDTIATDHAPHLLSEKEGIYFQAKSGAPLVQHALPMMLELYHQGKISLQKIVEKTSHHVAEIYRIKERGYIREGYFADLVLADINKPWQVNQQNLLYKCQWSPLTSQIFQSTITHTFVNGNLVYASGNIASDTKGKRLKFEKIRQI